MKAIIYSISLIGLFLVSCRPKPLDIEVESAPSKLVVFSHVIPDNFMIIALTKSFSVLEGLDETDYENLLVSGATVQVEVDGVSYPFYELSNGLYASFTPVQQDGQEFNLTAIHNQDTVTATTQVLSKVDFTNVEPMVEKLPSDTTVRIQMEFTDQAGIDNWYMINVYRKNADNDSELDGVNFFANGSNLLEETILVSDKEFNAMYSENRMFDGIQHDDSVVVTLSNISQDYFNYLSLREEGGSLFNQISLEPINYPTNVVNGYGFFNAHFPDIRFYDMSEY